MSKPEMLSTLLLILLVCIVENASQVFANFSPDFFSKLENSSHPFSGEPSLTVKYMLWNKCSQKFVRIKTSGRKGVDAKGRQNTRFTRVEITSVGPDLVTIKSERRGLYLCINRRGRLRARHNMKKRNCQFVQSLTSDGFVNYRLNGTSWYIGFKKRGRALPGFRKIPGTRLERCYDFNLKELYPKIKDGPFDFEKSDFVPVEEEDVRPRKRMRKIRHNRNKNRRRRNRRRKQKDRTINR